MLSDMAVRKAVGRAAAYKMAEARSKRAEIKKQIADGLSPAAQRKMDKITGPLANANTFKAVADEWLDKARREGRAEVTLGKLARLLDFAHPILGLRNIRDIKAIELLTVLRQVEQRGHYETARRLRSTCDQVFRYGIATGRADRDVSADLRGALTVPRVTRRAAIIEPAEAGALLRKNEEFTCYPVTRAALRLAAHVFARPSDPRRASASDGGTEIRVPRARKTGPSNVREHHQSCPSSRYSSIGCENPDGQLREALLKLAI